MLVFKWLFLGLKDSFIFSKNQRNRELVSYAAFVDLIIRYPATDDTTKALRMLILQPILLPPPAGTIIQTVAEVPKFISLIYFKWNLY